MPNQWGGIIGNSHLYRPVNVRTFDVLQRLISRYIEWQLCAVRAGSHLETSAPPLLIIYYTNPKIFIYISDRRRHAFYYCYTFEADAVLLVLFYLPTDPYFPPSHSLVALFCCLAELASSTLSMLCFMKYMSVHSPIPSLSNSFSIIQLSRIICEADTRDPEYRIALACPPQTFRCWVLMNSLHFIFKISTNHCKL